MFMRGDPVAAVLTSTDFALFTSNTEDANACTICRPSRQR